MCPWFAKKNKDECVQNFERLWCPALCQRASRHNLAQPLHFAAKMVGRVKCEGSVIAVNSSKCVAEMGFDIAKCLV